MKKQVKFLFATTVLGSMLFSTSILAQASSKTNVNDSLISTKTANPNLKISGGTGWGTKYEQTAVQNSGFSFKINNGSFLNVGVGQTFQSELAIDPAIADELFSVDNWQDYISGTISRNSPIIQLFMDDLNIKDLLKKDAYSHDSMWYEKDTHKLKYKSPSYLFGVTGGMNWEINFDMESFHRDHPDKVVERKNQYEFSAQAYNLDASINIPNSGKTTYLNWNAEDQWVENKVEPTTIDVDQQMNISGNGKQDLRNEHATKYHVELAQNGVTIVKNVSMKADGSWNVDGSNLNIQSGDVLSARVVGEETDSTNVKYSDWTDTSIGEPIPYDKWQVNDPAMIQPGQYDTSISLNLPNQNLQLGRTYDVVTTVNGKEVEKYSYNGHQQSHSVSLTNQALAVGDVVTTTIIGHQDGEADKQSQVISKTVGKDDDHPYDKWTVNKPSLPTVKSGARGLQVDVPEQDPYNSRTYDLKVYVNDVLVSTQSVSPASGVYAVSNIDADGNIQEFKVNDVIKAVVVGHENGEADKTSEEVSTIVLDGSDYDTWTVDAPKITNELYTDDSTVKVSIPSEDTQYNRSYAVDILVDGKVVKTVDLDSTNTSKDVKLDDKLKTGQKVTAEVVGHQADHKDKVSAKSNEVIVKDSNDQWTIAAPTLAAMTDTDKNASVTAPTLDSSNGRTYETKVSVNGKEVGTKAITSGETVSVPVSVKENDKVSAVIVGHQSGHDDKTSEKAEITVSHVAAKTSTEFKRGYWQNYGLVYEGRIHNKDWDLSAKDKISEVVQVVNGSGTVVKEVKASVMNWYDEKAYDGYQFIIDNDLLGSLDAGTYTYQIQATVNGVKMDPVALTNTMALRSGAYHDNYADLESTVLKENIVQPKLNGNTPAIEISKYAADAQMKVVNKYWSNQDNLVFDGYVTLANNRALSDVNYTKSLEIKDKSGAVVYTKNDLQQINTSWGNPTNVPLENTFQAIITPKYANQANFSYAIVVKDASGQVVNTFELK